MSLSADQLQFLLDRGMTLADAVDFARLASEKPLSKGAERTRKWRESKAKNVTGDVTVTDHGDVSHVGERTQVVTPSLPSLRSEELKIPPEKTSSSTPKGAETARGTRLSDDWSPPDGLIAGDFGMTHEQYANQAEVFRDYWRAVPGAKGRKADWPATWRNWIRRASENSARKAPHERPHHDAKFEARQANYAAHERGADLAARLRRES